MKEFETRLSELRLDNNFKQKDIAEFLNVNRTTYAKWENNINDISLENINKLANFYHVSIDYLMGYNNVNNFIKPTKINYHLLQQRLLNIRKKYHMSQYNLSKKIGFSQKTYSNYENGNRIPTTFKLLDIASFYNISLDYLLGKSNDNMFINTSKKQTSIRFMQKS